MFEKLLQQLQCVLGFLPVPKNNKKKIITCFKILNCCFF